MRPRRPLHAGALAAALLGALALGGCGPRWRRAASGTTDPLVAVWGSSPGDVYVVGAGVILHSRDHGATFTPQAIGTPALLFAVWGSGPGDVYAAGSVGVLLHTSDGGATWTAQKSGTPLPIHGLWGKDASEVVAAAGDDLAGSQVLATTDRGATWSVRMAVGELAARAGGVRPARVEAIELTGIWGAGRDLFAVGENETGGGEGVVFRSSDGGATWSRDERAARLHLHGVWGSAADDVYAVGSEGLLVHSSDRGATWVERPSGCRVRLSAVWGSGPEDVYAVGDRGTILHSVDRGRSWQRQPVPTSAWLRGVWGSGAGDVYVVGMDGTILHRS